MTVIGSSFTNNNALISFDTSTFTPGGAIANYNTLNVIGSTFSDNLAYWVGGAIYNEGKLTVTSSTFIHNIAKDGGTDGDSVPCFGGAIYNKGKLTVTCSNFINNSVNYGFGGAIENVK